MLHKFATCLTAATAAALGLASAASALLIDDFTTAENLSAPVIGAEVTDQVSGPGILGGERDGYLVLMSGASTTLNVNSGVAAHNEALASDSQMWFTWDGPDNNFNTDYTGLGGIDFTVGGTQDAFSVQISLNTQAATNLGFIAYTSAAAYSIVTFSAPSGASTQIVRYADFSPLGGPGANFANIGALKFFNQQAVTAQNIGFGRIQTTAAPEPASGALLGLGLLGIAIRRR